MKKNCDFIEVLIKIYEKVYFVNNAIKNYLAFINKFLNYKIVLIE